jgi:putative tryptophan/tyrosine transport system substrate-binding protein
VKRRRFITLLGGAVAAWPLAARAQRPATPIVGFVRSTTFADAKSFVTAFLSGLQEAGYIDGQNVAIEFRSAEGRNDRLPDLISDLISRQVAVIAGNGIAVIAAKALTTTVPLVFTTGADPVALGLATSLNQPGGNITGVTFFAGLLGAKRLGLLRQLVPSASTIGVLVHPNTTETEADRQEIEAAAKAVGQELVVLQATNEHDIESAFDTFVERRVGALLVGSGSFMFSNRERVVALATRQRLPAMYSSRPAALAGGLASYSGGQIDAYRQAGSYVARILKGEKPGDLPIVQSTKFELVLNLRTAKTLDLEIPPTLLALADEVIE